MSGLIEKSRDRAKQLIEAQQKYADVVYRDQKKDYRFASEYNPVQVKLIQNGVAAYNEVLMRLKKPQVVLKQAENNNYISHVGDRNQNIYPNYAVEQEKTSANLMKQSEIQQQKNGIDVTNAAMYERLGVSTKKAEVSTIISSPISSPINKQVSGDSMEQRAKKRENEKMEHLQQAIAMVQEDAKQQQEMKPRK